MGTIIRKVTIDGDLLEVEAKIDDEVKKIRRHVQGYENLSRRAKQALHKDIVGNPQIEYELPGPVKPKLSWWRRLFS